MIRKIVTEINKLELGIKADLDILIQQIKVYLQQETILKDTSKHT